MVSPKAIEAFFEESDTHLEVIETSLLSLEKDSADFDIIDELFRAVHSMKGNAGLVGFNDIHEVSTDMETLLDDIRKQRKPVGQGLRDTLFSLLDKVKGLVGEQKPDDGTHSGGGGGDSGSEKASPAAKNKKKAKDGNAEVVKAKAAKPKKAYLTFMLGDEEYGLEIQSVREIIIRRHITRIPHARDFVKGIMNLRGMVIPVIDAKKKLVFKKTHEDSAENVIVVETDGVPTGVLVDQVKDIIKFDEDMIVPATKALGPAADSEYISGIGKTGKLSIMLLDVSRFCSSTEQYF